MWKKISIQLILLSLALFSIFFAYKIYFSSEKNFDEKKVNIVEPRNDKKKEVIIADGPIADETNLIKNLRYVSKDSLGNEYIIGSRYSELSENDDDIINMKDVSAQIIMVNSEPIFIKSE